LDEKLHFYEQIKKDSKEVKVRTKSSQIVILPVLLLRSFTFLKRNQSNTELVKLLPWMFSKICELFSSDVNAFAKCPGFLGGLKPFFKS